MKNKDHAAFGLPQYVIEKLCSIFETYQNIICVIIYGSRAMGNYRIGSDIDLCIESQALTLSELLKIENQIDDLDLPWKVDISIKNRIDNPNLLQHISKVGVTFYPLQQTGNDN